jgi:hypothetical protein
LKNVVQGEEHVTSIADPKLFAEERCNKFVYIYTRSVPAIDFHLPTPAHTHIEGKAE